ncbi:MAG: ABC transporter substrate-binding protein [Thermoleophilia bacterium]|nr:ABC transporter substrate-binding protein [Thermoleophilia bacterium]
MYGHRTPRRTTARSPLSLFFILLLLAALFACAPVLVACGSDGDAGAETTNSAAATTEAAAPVTTAPVESTVATDATATTEATETTEAQSAEGSFPVTVTDDLGNSVTIETRPERIVSTAPANTETLFALGVGDRVVGVTSLDDYPPEAADIAKIGDYQANTEAIVALDPDLVVGYSGNEEALAPLQDAGVPVLIMNPVDLAGVYSNITTIGAATGATGAAADLVASLQALIEETQEAATATGESPTVFYALDNTLWTCGPGSFVDELLNLAGGANVASPADADPATVGAYYQFSPEQLVAADPEVILLPGSVYTAVDEFTADPRFANLRAVTEGRVLVIDDVIVTRPGPRIGEGLKTLAEAVHPGAF